MSRETEDVHIQGKTTMYPCAGHFAWLPISTAPRDGTMVLLGGAGRVIPAYFSAEEGGDGWWRSFGKEEGLCSVYGLQYWMPLPAGPDEVVDRLKSRNAYLMKVMKEIAGIDPMSVDVDSYYAVSVAKRALLGLTDEPGD